MSMSIVISPWNAEIMENSTFTDKPKTSLCQDSLMKKYIQGQIWAGKLNSTLKGCVTAFCVFRNVPVSRLHISVKCRYINPWNKNTPKSISKVKNRLTEKTLLIVRLCRDLNFFFFLFKLAFSLRHFLACWNFHHNKCWFHHSCLSMRVVVPYCYSCPTTPSLRIQDLWQYLSCRYCQQLTNKQNIFSSHEAL